QAAAGGPDPRPHRREHLAAAPARHVSLHEAEYQPERGAGRQDDAGTVDRCSRAEALWNATVRQRNDNEADRDVDPEDPLPSGPLCDRTANDRAGDEREPGHATEDPQRLGA